MVAEYVTDLEIPLPPGIQSVIKQCTTMESGGNTTLQKQQSYNVDAEVVIISRVYNYLINPTVINYLWPQVGLFYHYEQARMIALLLTIIIVFSPQLGAQLPLLPGISNNNYVVCAD